MRFVSTTSRTALFLSPLLIPHIVFGFALLIFLTIMGIDDVFTGLLIGHLLVTLPYAIRTVLASLSLIPQGLVEASMVLGANEYRALWDVVIPLARPGIVAGGIISLAISMDEVTMMRPLLCAFM